MKRNFFRVFAVLGILGLYAACTDNTTAPKNDVGPGRPVYSETQPFNDDAQCMANDAVAAPTGTVDGVKFGGDATKAMNCTSNDVSVAHADIISYQLTDANGNFLPPVAWHPGDQVSCIEG